MFFSFIRVGECLKRELFGIGVKVLQKGVRGFPIEHWELRNWGRVRHWPVVAYAVRLRVGVFGETVAGPHRGSAYGRHIFGLGGHHGRSQHKAVTDLCCSPVPPV
jgi:hypothetical protein